jgi:hypothetical protein
VVGTQLLAGDVDADGAARDEPDALGGKLLQPPIDVVLFQLEVGNAVPQQPADLVAAFVEGDRVAGPRELLCRRHPGRTGPDDGDRTPGRRARRQRDEPAVVDHPVDDLDLYLLDSDRAVADAEHAGRLARRRTEPSGELGEVVRRVERLARVRPALRVDQVIPRRDQIAQRAALMAERDAAVHATRGLLDHELVLSALGDFTPVG